MDQDGPGIPDKSSGQDVPSEQGCSPDEEKETQCCESLFLYFVALEGQRPGIRRIALSEGKEKSSVAAIVGILVFFFIVFFMVAGAVFAMVSGGEPEGEQLGVVEVTGTIESADSTVRALQDFSDDEMIRGVLVRINSPGGTVSASQEIVEAIRAVQKPVVISMGDMAASGAFYVACAGPKIKIYASAGTLTGSIGVISQVLEFKDVLEFLKVQVHTIKTGDLKDAGSPYREFNETDKQYFTHLGLEILDQFVTHVAEARNLPKEQITKIADGRVWSGREAKALGLIDEIGGFNAALNDLKSQTKIQGKALLVYPKRASDDLLYSLIEQGASQVTQGIAAGAKTVVNQPRGFMYLYR